MRTAELWGLTFVAIVCASALRPVKAADAPGTQPATLPAGVSVHFLTAAAGRAAIVDETNDPYFKLLEPMEMSAKTGQPITGATIEAERDECRRRYQAAVMEFTLREKQLVESMVSQIAPTLVAHFPLVAKTPWNFIKASADLEGGKAFTRGSCIVVSTNTLEAMGKDLDKDGEKWVVLLQSGEELLCEQMALVQRQHPDLFNRMYSEFWGMKHVDTIDPGVWLQDHQMLDPDAADALWIYQLKDGPRTRWIWPVRILGNAQNAGGPKFSDIQLEAVTLDANGESGFRVQAAPNGGPMLDSLLNFPQYTSRFSPSEKVYNPARAAADLFARIVITEEVLPPVAPPEAKDAIEKGRIKFKPIRDRFEKMLGNGQ